MAVVLTSKFITILEFVQARIDLLRLSDLVRIDFSEDPAWKSIGINIFPMSDEEDQSDPESTTINKIIHYHVGINIAFADENTPEQVGHLLSTRERILKSFRTQEKFDATGEIPGNLSVQLPAGSLGVERESDTNIISTEFEIIFRVQFAYDTPVSFTAEYGVFTFPIYPDYAIVEAAFDKGFKKEFHLKGILEGSTSAAIKTARDLLVAALTDGKDLKIKDGATVLDELLQVDTVDGVKVMLIEFPESREGEWITKRTFSIKFEGEVKNGASDQRMFMESIKRVSSLKRQEPREVLNGTTAAIIQTSSLTAAFATQFGVATGYTTWPSVPAKKFSASKLIREEVEKKSPEIQKDGTLTNYEIKWNFEYVDSTDFADNDPTNPAL